jgi:hypothetical protein
MAGLGDLFSEGSIGEQIFVWGVLNQVITALGAPFFELLQQEVSEAFPETLRDPGTLASLVARGWIDEHSASVEARKSGLQPGKFSDLVKAAKVQLAPADLAQLVVRNFIGRDEAAKIAARSGVDAADLDQLVRISADAPSPGDLAVALRRGLIPADGTGPDSTSFRQGILEGRLGDKWIDMMRALSVQWPSPTDAQQAELVGLLDHQQALALYEKLGGDPQFYDWQFFIHGSAPTPTELNQLVNRGIIPDDSGDPHKPGFVQGFLQGPWRNEWMDPYRKLRTYVIPPRSVTAMIHSGSLTDAQAAAEFAKSGLTPEQAAAMIADAHSTAAQADKQLTQSSVIALYESRIIAHTDADQLLQALGYSADNAGYLLALADLRRANSEVTTAVSRVRTLYVGHKINSATASATLSALQVPADQIGDIVSIWSLEAAVNVKTLTESQIIAAWSAGVIDVAEARAELVGAGYTPRDAWILLSTKNGAPLPDEPTAGPAPPG